MVYEGGKLYKRKQQLFANSVYRTAGRDLELARGPEPASYHPQNVAAGHRGGVGLMQPPTAVAVDKFPGFPRVGPGSYEIDCNAVRQRVKGVTGWTKPREPSPQKVSEASGEDESVLRTGNILKRNRSLPFVPRAAVDSESEESDIVCPHAVIITVW